MWVVNARRPLIPPSHHHSQLSAIGALLDYLAKVREMADLENEGVSGLEIRAIESVCLSVLMKACSVLLLTLLIARDQFMQINADALS